MSDNGSEASTTGNGSTPGPGGRGIHLPPPAFPPGARRVQLRRAAARRMEELGEAYISPDDPMPDRAESAAGAFISPDDPIPERSDETPFISPDDPIPPRSDEGVVTGMDLDAHLDAGEVGAPQGDPHVEALTRKVAALAEALTRRGEAGLRSSTEMDRFDATLRAYCVGYLAGRRAEDA